MTWDVTDLGFRMGLSPRVPDVLAREVGGVVDELLTGAGLRIEDVAGWAVHPGGPRTVVRDQLGLVEEQLGVAPRARRARQLLVGDRPARAGGTGRRRRSGGRHGVRPGAHSLRGSPPPDLNRAAGGPRALRCGYEIPASGRDCRWSRRTPRSGSSWSTTTRSSVAGWPRCWRTTRGSPWRGEPRWPRRWSACPPSGPTSWWSTCACPTATERALPRAAGARPRLRCLVLTSYSSRTRSTPPCGPAPRASC